MKGRAIIVQPPLTGKSVMPDRNLDGFRMAGKDTDIIPTFWDKKMQKKGERMTFEYFEARYHDLIVYDTEGAEPALNAFRGWCRRRRISWNFERFWRARNDGSGIPAIPEKG